MFGTLIPSGPLHPEAALAALVVGLVVGLVTRFTAGAALATVAAAGFVLELKYDGVLWDGVSARPSPMWAALGAAIATVLIAWLAAPRVERSMRSAGLVMLAPVAVVWALVADTEAPLIGGVVLFAVIAVGPERPGAVATAPAVIAPVAALIGSVGRPSQLALALAAAVAWACCARLGFDLLDAVRRRRQRAGTPTTVDPGGTSSTTTAPAATIAP